jgi:hypothetical protein
MFCPQTVKHSNDDAQFTYIALRCSYYTLETGNWKIRSRMYIAWVKNFLNLTCFFYLTKLTSVRNIVNNILLLLSSFGACRFWISELSNNWIKR